MNIKAKDRPELVEAVELFAALTNPQCHWNLANPSSFEVDLGEELKIVYKYLETIIGHSEDDADVVSAVRDWLVNIEPGSDRTS